MKDSELWDAVTRRDSLFDGQFVFAVRTTGIYCRPSCPSKRPKRENVEFFSNTTEAAAAGYRACLRCKPDTPKLVPPNRAEKMALKRERFKTALREGSNVTDAIYDAGFGSPSRVYESAQEWLGMTPGQYQRGGEGLRIRYAVAGCVAGRLLLAATDKGVCAAALGEDAGKLVSDLRDEYPRASIEKGDDSLHAWAEEAARTLGQCNLPLDVTGTPFQLAVWRELRGIPRGERRTYSQIAVRLGQPAAVRAVANACAKNPVALLIPCHRVVRQDGSLAGYRWGAARKRVLLEADAATQPFHLTAK